MTRAAPSLSQVKALATNRVGMLGGFWTRTRPLRGPADMATASWPAREIAAKGAMSRYKILAVDGRVVKEKREMIIRGIGVESAYFS
jgi:hypothetical protein